MTSDSTGSPALAPPAQWPKAVVSEFEPLQILGKGGFASVILARRKKSDPTMSKDDRLVAIKIVGGRNATKMERGYAHREIDILSELKHPRIMRLLNYWEPAPEERKCAAVMALSYIRGPTLAFILKEVGAPAINFGRLISAQLVDVVAFLHSHAVIHRDIKPDNLIVTGVSLSQEELYEDSTESPDWELLLRKFPLTLIDFGFARPLRPEDVNVDVGLEKSMRGDVSLPKFDKSLDKSLHNRMVDLSLSHHSTKSLRSGKDVEPQTLDLSRSKVIVRKMSALGNKFYAAPEVQRGVKDIRLDKSRSKRQKNTLSNFVSDYGMVADAFSVGATIRYILTGVPPNENIDEVIRAQKNPIAKASRWLGKKLAKPDEAKKRKKRYRKIKECPPEAVKLMLGMTLGDSKKRTTVRAARLYPWINDILEDTDAGGVYKMKFLDCATKGSDETL